MSNLTEVLSVKQWNESLRSATASGRTVMVDFWAVWCGPCKTMGPIYANLAKQWPQVHFLKVDVDKQKAIAAKYQITAMPTFLVIKAGTVIESIKGADPTGLTRLVTTHAGPNPPIAPLPEGAEKAKNEGNALFKDGKWEEAIVKYSEAIELAPTSALLYANRSFTYLKSAPTSSSPSSTLASSLSDARKSTELEPLWAKGWVRLGDALEASAGDSLDKEKGSKVVEAFEKAVTLAKEGNTGMIGKEAKEKLEKVKGKLGWH